MVILSHRGYWQEPFEKNQKVAFERSFSLGFGTETDIRDYRGELVISHDIASEHAMQLTQMLEIYKMYDDTLFLALNIKSDGLQLPLKEMLHRYGIKNYFVFDMSVPDGLGYIRERMNPFTRQSEYEKDPSYYENAVGIWLDEFQGHWISDEVIAEHLKHGKKICIVSPDLHKRDYSVEWQHYKMIENKLGVGHIMLCTDHPERAREYFND